MEATAYLIPNDQLVAAVIADKLRRAGHTQPMAAAALNMSVPATQSLLAGRTHISLSRLRHICYFLDIDEVAVFTRRNKLLALFQQQLPAPATLLPEFPTTLGFGQRIIRCPDILTRIAGKSWNDILHSGVMTSDDLLRHRTTRGWTVAELAEQFDVAPNTLRYWERTSFPAWRDLQARQIFDLLDDSEV